VLPTLIFVAFCILLLFLHTKVSEARQRAESVAPAKKIKLAYKFEKGRVLNYENIRYYKIYLQNTLLMNFNVRQQFTQKILNVYSDGSADIAFTDFKVDLDKILSTGFEVNLPGESRTGEPLHPESDDKIQATMTVTPLGKIIASRLVSPSSDQNRPLGSSAPSLPEQQGSDLEKFADELPPEVRLLLPTLKTLFTGLDDLLLNLYGMENHRINLIFTFTTLPENLVTLGNQWTHEESYTFDSFTPNIDLVTKSDFSLQSVEYIKAREVVRVLINGVYQGLGQEASYKEFSSLSFTGTITGEEKIDNTTGILLELTSRIEGDILLESTLGTFPIRTEMTYLLRYLE